MYWVFPGRWYLVVFITIIGEVTSHKIAIVGGGIGGTSNAFFLQQLLKDKAQIKIFERGDVGGRLREMQIGGRSYDSGGSIIHSDNFYARALTEKVGLKVRNLDKGGGTGFYDGKEFVLKLTGSTFKDKFKVLGRYGFGIRNIVKDAEMMLKTFKRIYCLQSKKVAFKSTAELLNSTSPDFLKRAQVSMRQSLKTLGVSELIQNELIAAAMHTNYNQELDVNAFVGFVSLAGGLVGDLWRVEEGNFRLPQELVKATGVEVVKSKVRSILPSSRGTGYTVTYTLSGDTEDFETEDFDAVVLATPLHNADLQLPDKVDVAKNTKPFQRTIATFVNGILAPVVPGQENPEDILTVWSKEDLFFSSIGFKGSATPDFNYKIFSKTPLTGEQIGKLFSKVNEVKSVDWKAYPKYSVPDTLPDFELAPGLFYINAIESAASAIEMSCIGSKNVALLLFQYLENVENVDFKTVCRQQDLIKFKEEL
ncbi:hypothetical protein ACHWQZ_G017136 [Mnemiopsis leidyi]